MSRCLFLPSDNARDARTRDYNQGAFHLAVWCLTIKSREISTPRYTDLCCPIVLKFDKCLGSNAVKIQNDTIILTLNLVGSRFHEIWQNVLTFSDWRPRVDR